MLEIACTYGACSSGPWILGGNPRSHCVKIDATFKPTTTTRHDNLMLGGQRRQGDAMTNILIAALPLILLSSACYGASFTDGQQCLFLAGGTGNNNGNGNTGSTNGYNNTGNNNGNYNSGNNNGNYNSGNNNGNNNSGNNNGNGNADDNNGNNGSGDNQGNGTGSFSVPKLNLRFLTGP